MYCGYLVQAGQSLDGASQGQMRNCPDQYPKLKGYIHLRLLRDESLLLSDRQVQIAAIR